MSYRIVIDTNVIVSAILNPSGTPAYILDAVMDGRFSSITSHALLEEARRVFAYPKLKRVLARNKVGPEATDQYLDRLSQISTVVPGETTLDVIEGDPDDNMVIACALEGQADYVVTGDQHILALREYQGIEICSPGEFRSVLEETSGN